MNYIGSKRTLLNFIVNTVDLYTQKDNIGNKIFCDLFAGTAVVGKAFKNKGYNIISNDIQYYSYIQQYVNLVIDEIPKFEKFGGIESFLNI